MANIRVGNHHEFETLEQKLARLEKENADLEAQLAEQEAQEQREPITEQVDRERNQMAEIPLTVPDKILSYCVESIEAGSFIGVLLSWAILIAIMLILLFAFGGGGGQSCGYGGYMCE